MQNPQEQIVSRTDPEMPMDLRMETKKAKARLVVLGFLDPALDKVQRDSPTLGRQSRMLILQLIASMN